MKVNVTGGNLIKTGFVLISIFIAVSVALGADSPAKRVKQPSTQATMKQDPGEWKKILEAAKTGGSTQNSLVHMAFMYGENFIRELLSKQDVIVTDDDRQQVEWVIRGKNPIAVGLNTPQLIPFEKQGLGKNVKELDDKLIRLTSGYGTVNLLEGAPHPNAVKVYLNWLLSQKTQTMLCRNVELNSSRTNVPVIDKKTAVDTTRLSRYRNGNTEENKEVNDSLLPMINEALKK